VFSDVSVDGGNHRNGIELQLGGIFNISRKLLMHNVAHEIRTSLGFPIDKTSVERFMSLPSGKDHLLLPSISFSESDMCVAVILVSRKNSIRTSYVRDGIGRQITAPNSLGDEVKFIHISYLDNIPSIGNKEINCWVAAGIFVTADLCINDYDSNERIRVQNIIKSLSLLFMSDSEYVSLFQSELNDNSIKSNPLLPNCVAIHSEDALYIKIGLNFTKLIGVKYKGVTSLGMGDSFVAHFYKSYLENGSILESLKLSFFLCQKEALAQSTEGK
jgi:hypothetical protein